MTALFRAATVAAALFAAACGAAETEPVSLAPVPGAAVTINSVRARPVYSVSLRERTAEVSGHDPNTVSFGFAVTASGPLPAGATVGVRFACQYGDVVYATPVVSAPAAELVAASAEEPAKGRATPTPPELLHRMPAACEASFIYETGAATATALGAACWTPGRVAAGACPADVVRRIPPAVTPVALRDVHVTFLGASTSGFAVDVAYLATLSTPVPAPDARLLGDVICESAGKAETGAIESTSPTLLAHLAPGESTYGSGQAFRVARLAASPARCEVRLVLAHGGPLGPRIPLAPVCFDGGGAATACAPPPPAP